MESRYDVVVVGSGFGGGVTACRLAEQGMRVCVLERGRRFGPGDFPDRPEQAPHGLLAPDPEPGRDVRPAADADLSVLTAAGVGGGSLVYANVQLRAPDDVFERPRLAGGDRPAPSSTPTTTAPRRRSIRRRRRPSRRCRRSAPSTRWPSAPGARRSGCRSPCTSARTAAIRSAASSSRAATTSGAATSAARVLAKNTVDITYVARAEAHGAEVFPLHEVLRIDPPAERRRDVAGRLPRPAVPDRRRGGGAACSCWPPARSARPACC